MTSENIVGLPSIRLGLGNSDRLMWAAYFLEETFIPALSANGVLTGQDATTLMDEFFERHADSADFDLDHVWSVSMRFVLHVKRKPYLSSRLRHESQCYRRAFEILTDIID